MARRQERRLAQRQRGVVVGGIGRRVVVERVTHVLLEPRIGGNADAELGELAGEIERAGAAQEVVGRPAALHSEAVERAVSRADPDAPQRCFRHAHDHPHGRVAAGPGRRVGQHHVDRAEHPQPVQVALRHIQLILPEPVPRPHREHAPHAGRVDLAGARDDHFAHPHPPTGDALERRHRPERGRVHVVALQHVGIRVAAVLESAHDRVGGRLEQRPVERVPDLERQRALQGRHGENRVDTEHVQRGEAHRVALIDPERHVHIPRLAAHHGIEHRVHVAALAVQQQQPHHVAPELELVEVPLFPEPRDPAEIPLGRERA